MSVETLSAWLHGFHFLRPVWLLALPPLWLLAIALSRGRGRDGDWSRLIDAELLAGLRLDGAGGRTGATPWPWLALAWTAAVLALAGPAWQQQRAPAYRSGAAWVLVLDLSPSMAAADVAPDRVTRARYALDDVLGAAHDARVGLIVFGEDAYTVTPLTSDVATVRALLSPLAPDILPTAGDRLAPALERAGELLAAVPARERRVLVLSDGFDDPAAAMSAASRLAAAGVRVSVLGVGTEAGAPLPQATGGFAEDAGGRTRLTRLDPGLLRSLASAGGGAYEPLAGLPRMLDTLAQVAGSAARRPDGEDVRLSQWRDEGVWLLPLILLLAAPLARRGWLS